MELSGLRELPPQMWLCQMIIGLSVTNTVWQTRHQYKQPFNQSGTRATSTLGTPSSHNYLSLKKEDPSTILSFHRLRGLADWFTFVYKVLCYVWTDIYQVVRSTTIVKVVIKVFCLIFSLYLFISNFRKFHITSIFLKSVSRNYLNSVQFALKE